MNTRIFLIVLSAFVLASCGKTKPSGDGPSDSPEAGTPATASNPLLDPSCPEMNRKAPGVYKAKFETTAGDFVIEVHRDWAPHGADRFYNLVRNGYFDGTRFFRVVPGFVVQWGMSGDPRLNAVWQNASIPDDPVVKSNTRGMVTFATGGPNTRTNQVFVNYADKNKSLDGRGFAPFGKVVTGMDVVDRIHSEYGQTPRQDSIYSDGNAYLSKYFPNLDEVKKAHILE